ncbi:L,D-transpeptidase family protein [Pelosinus baikalensis]|uniref:L,D-transpeptidase family protein n=1 Tax=Pelosinus baikalensis TaxID=2892015 RepID=A0ABS8HYL6_9FIRM|nr:L,D-transpeptidase family protein [Pelosinus baikalensis]
MVKLHSIIINWRKAYFAIASVMIFGLLIGVLGFEYLDELELAAIPGQTEKAPTGKVTIVVKISDRILELHNDGKLYKTYRIAVGKRDTPTPIGEWIVIWKSFRSGDIFGTRFLGLDVPWGGYGIHGTNRPWSIGHFISHGCIRLRNNDIEELFEWVPVGTPVRIEGKIIPMQRTLKYEATGTDVVQLQVKLKKLGYLEGRADGFFNRDTEEAVKRYQHDQGVKANGIVDRKILELLGL